MHRQAHRSPSASLLEDYAAYLLGEVWEILKIVGIMFLAVYLLISMAVGMYTVALWLFWMLWSVI